MHDLIQDIRFGSRILLKHPGFTALAVLVLALGIGANIASFSIAVAALIEDLRCRHASYVARMRAGLVIFDGLYARHQGSDSIPAAFGRQPGGER